MMGMKHWALAAACVSALGLTACQSERLGRLNTQPAPLTPAPVSPVTQEQLPPPSQPETLNPSGFPDAPGTEADGTEIAAVDPAQPAAPPAGAEPLTKNAMVGSWSANSAGSSCQMFLTLTKYGSGSRGGTRGCSGDMANVRGWDVQGAQVVLYNESGDTVARLYKSGNQKFDGTTSSGQAVSVFR